MYCAICILHCGKMAKTDKVKKGETYSIFTKPFWKYIYVEYYLGQIYFLPLQISTSACKNFAQKYNLLFISAKVANDFHYNF